jgi:uncharacterized phage-associated protein
MNDIIPLAKIKAILKYFCTNTDPKFLGKVKLMKLFYYLDFIHVKRHGVPVTYDTYFNLEHGPIPTVIKNLVDSVDDDIDSAYLEDTISVVKGVNSNMHRITCQSKFTESEAGIFTNTELEILKEVCERFGDKNTKFIEDQSHEEAPWSMTSQGDKIPYELAANDPDCVVSKEEIKLMSNIF